MEVYAILAGLFLAAELATYFWGWTQGRASERKRVTEWLSEMAESGQDAQEAEDEARRDSRGRMLDDARDIVRDTEADDKPPGTLSDYPGVAGEDRSLSGSTDGRGRR